MFCIKIAGVVIEIDNKYKYLRYLCQDYMVKDELPAFRVSATEEEILEEQGGYDDFPVSYCESWCIYRKLCKQLVCFDAFLMHAAVIAVDGEAYAFTAKSGTGKTTHMGLWLEKFGNRAEVVNGDKPVLRFIDGTLYACGTPWCGKEGMSNNIMRPLRAVCFLEQSPENYIRRLDLSEVIDRIFYQLLLPDDTNDFDHYMDLLEHMLSSVDCYLLQCNREPEAAELSYETMRRK